MKVLFVSGIDGGTRRYRCTHHQEQLRLAGIESALREADDPQMYVDGANCDILILHRTPYSQQVADLIDIAHVRGKPVLFDTDDLIFVPEIHDRIGLWDTMNAHEIHRMQRDLAALRKTLQQSDYAIVPTEYLSRMAEAEGTPAYVQRNAFSEEMAQVAGPAHQFHIQARSGDHDVTIGYFSGTGSHNRDFATVTPVLLEVMDANADVQLLLGGPLDISPEFDAFTGRILHRPFVSWRELPGIIAQVDINLAPLELDNPFCQAKSEIKYVEAALVGVPTIATPVGAFQHAIRHTENGMLADDLDAWRSALDYLMVNPRLRHAMGEAARQHVLQHYNPNERSLELVQLLNRVVDGFTPVSVDSAKAPEVVAKCMMRRMGHLSESLERQQEQLVQLRRALLEAEMHSQNSFWRQEWEQTERLYADDLRHILNRMQRSS